MTTRIQVQPATDMQNTLPKLRTVFCQLLEELKIRRENDRESDRRIKELVSVQHGLEEELEEGAIKLQRLREEQHSKLDEQRKMFEDEIKDSEEEKVRAQLLYDTSMKEIKALRDEIRKLHLSKFSLEKIIKDQECKLQLMNSSRDSYQLQISQIETQSTVCGQQLAELEEALNSLQINVTAAVSVNEEVRVQNTSYSCQLDKMREESNRLLEKVYKNPLYEQRQQGEGKESCEVVKLKVQLKFNKDRIGDLEKELSNVNLNLTHTQKSLQECHNLITNQSRTYKRMEEEVKKCEKEKVELEKEREKEIDEFKNKITSIEEEKEKLQEENIQMTIQLDSVFISEANEKEIEAGVNEHKFEYLSQDIVTGVDTEPIILCPDSQEMGQSQESTTAPSDVNYKKYEIIHSSQEPLAEDPVSEKQDNVKLLDSPEIAGMPNKRTKLDYQTNSPNKSPIQFPQAS